MRDRTKARQLAAESLARGDPTGWFEALYAQAGESLAGIPWADCLPNPNLLEFWQRHPIPGAGKSALVVGCGLGDDAEQISAWHFDTTAFDVAPSAIDKCKRRFPVTSVHYAVANLLDPPPQWTAAFDFVFEAYTLQALPADVRRTAIRNVASFVKPGGHLLIVARARDEHDPTGEMPWPLTRTELESIGQYGFDNLLFEDYLDHNDEAATRRFRAFWVKTTI